MQKEDPNILKRLKKEDQTAYKELFDLYYIPLCIYSLKIVDSYDEAEDIVQEIFVNFWNQKLHNRIEKTIRSYLFTSVKNNSLLYLKKSNKIIFESIDELNLDFSEVDLLDVDELNKRKKALYQEIEALPPKCKEVFMEIVLNDLKYKEAADKLGVSVNTIKTNFSRALKKLRNSSDIIVLLMLSQKCKKTLSGLQT
jgi:RNA polymerase sigma-70 factor (ECF subfamily)